MQWVMCMEIKRGTPQTTFGEGTLKLVPSRQNSFASCDSQHHWRPVTVSDCYLQTLSHLLQQASFFGATAEGQGSKKQQYKHVHTTHHEKQEWGLQQACT